MSNDFLPHSNLTDEELLSRVYLSNDVSPIMLELATRLQHALDELRTPKQDINTLLSKYGSEPINGDEAGG